MTTDQIKYAIYEVLKCISCIYSATGLIGLRHGEELSSQQALCLENSQEFLLDALDEMDRLYDALDNNDEQDMCGTEDCACNREGFYWTDLVARLEELNKNLDKPRK